MPLKIYVPFLNKDRTVISRHIRNIYKEDELEKDITCAKFAHMAHNGLKLASLLKKPKILGSLILLQ